MPRVPLILLSLLGFCLLLASGCQRASRYPATSSAVATPSTPEEKSERPTVPAHYGWYPTTKRPDVPIVFVDAVSQPDEWKKLPHFWNDFPAHYAGMRTLHLGQSPLGAVLMMALADQMQIVKIKVPLGLPNPAAEIPDVNPPTLGKWLLGKRLFFDTTWLTADSGMSCASCHAPRAGFSEDRPPAGVPRMNAPGLINCVYNKHQFWDGRVRELEEGLQRQLSDEAPPVERPEQNQLPVIRHVWSGIIPRLDSQPAYRDSFRQVFGIPSPTVDATAKALATYMRTILSGNSLYDQARQRAEKEGSRKLTENHFLPFLDEAMLKRLHREKAKKDTVANELARGYRLFHSSHTRCATCHKGWNFTDNSFHNISIRESDHLINRLKWEGSAYGRFLQLPLGLKDATMIGAFKTPSLRNLPRTAPYFHDGSQSTLEDAVHWYNKEIHDQVNHRLDPILRNDSGKALQMNLTPEEVEALALFLRALDGKAVSAVVAIPPK